MNKLTIKWKLFLVVNYLLLLANLAVIVRVIYNLANSAFIHTIPGIVFLLAFLFLTLLLIGILNIYIIHRHFPDNPLSSKIRKLFNFARVLMVVITAGLLFINLAVLSALSDISDRERWTDMLAVYFFGFLFLSSLFILILQFQIPDYLNRNHAGKINSLIDSIGN